MYFLKGFVDEVLAEDSFRPMAQTTIISPFQASRGEADWGSQSEMGKLVDYPLANCKASDIDPKAEINWYNRATIL